MSRETPPAATRVAIAIIDAHRRSDDRWFDRDAVRKWLRESVDEKTLTTVLSAFTSAEVLLSRDDPDDARRTQYRLALDESGGSREQVQVETLTGTQAIFEFDSGVVESLRETLEGTDTTVACIDCGNLAPVAGGLPAEMPECKLCGSPMEGVTEVTFQDR